MSSHHDYQAGLGSLGVLLLLTLVLFLVASDLGFADFLRTLAAPIISLGSFFH